MNRINPFVPFAASFALTTGDGSRTWKLTHERPEGTEQAPEGNGWFASYGEDGTLLIAQPLCYAFMFIDNYVLHEEARSWLRKEVHNYAKWLTEFNRTAGGADGQVLDAFGNRLTSYGPRRTIENAAVPCAHWEAEYFGVYTHDADGFATWVDDVPTAELAFELACRIADGAEVGA